MSARARRRKKGSLSPAGVEELAESEELTLRVLRMFDAMGKEALDLHELFEAGGNDPDARLAVFDIVERLAREGALEERGNDFYALTAEGRVRAARTGAGEG